MNREEQEFFEADTLLGSRLGGNAFNVAGDLITLSPLLSNENRESTMVRWSRGVNVGSLSLIINTPAYGGTSHSGRKLYAASTILGSWLLSDGKEYVLDRDVYEIGCGSTGIPGMCSVASGARSVHFFDIDEDGINELSENITQNFTALNAHRSVSSLPLLSYDTSVTTKVMDWQAFSRETNTELTSRYPVVVASEIVYGATEVELLVKCIDCILKNSSEAGEKSNFILCQSAHGRGSIQDFLDLMTGEEYRFECESVEYHEALEDIENPLVFYIFSRDK